MLKGGWGCQYSCEVGTGGAAACCCGGAVMAGGEQAGGTDAHPAHPVAPPPQVGLVTFGTHVHVHELGFSECPKAFVFRGSKDYTPQQVQVGYRCRCRACWNGNMAAWMGTVMPAWSARHARQPEQ